jgi:hypothetical protein
MPADAGGVVRERAGNDVRIVCLVPSITELAISRGAPAPRSHAVAIRGAEPALRW